MDHLLKRTEPIQVRFGTVSSVDMAILLEHRELAKLCRISICAATDFLGRSSKEI